MHGLYAKNFAVLLMLLLTVAQLSVWDRASMGFVAETDQKLNHNLAADLAARFSRHLADNLD